MNGNGIVLVFVPLEPVEGEDPLATLLRAYAERRSSFLSRRERDREEWEDLFANETQAQLLDIYTGALKEIMALGYDVRQAGDMLGRSRR